MRSADSRTKPLFGGGDPRPGGVSKVPASSRQARRAKEALERRRRKAGGSSQVRSVGTEEKRG